MSRFVFWCLSFVLSSTLITSHAQPVTQSTGTLVIVPAYAEVKHRNDEAHAILMVEEQDKDKAAAASRVNQKMKQGMEIIRHQDPSATLKTRGYYTYPVYADEQSRPIGKGRQPVSWRVGHYLEMTTTNLDGLPKTIASVQQVLALNGLNFGLTEATTKMLDGARIEAAYENLTQRIAAIAKAMGRAPADATLDTVDFEASGAYAPQQEASMPKTMRAAVEPVQIEEPSFEPGETTLSMRVVGKVRFK